MRRAIPILLGALVSLPTAAQASPPEPGAHNPACRRVEHGIPRGARIRIVKACLRDLDDEVAVVLGLHTAMAGDIRLLVGSRGYGVQRMRGYARAALNHPDAERRIQMAMEGAAQYAPVIHQGDLWTTPDNMVSHNRSLMMRAAKQGEDSWLWYVVFGLCLLVPLVWKARTSDAAAGRQRAFLAARSAIRRRHAEYSRRDIPGGPTTPDGRD